MNPDSNEIKKALEDWENNPQLSPEDEAALQRQPKPWKKGNVAAAIIENRPMTEYQKDE